MRLLHCSPPPPQRHDASAPQIDPSVHIQPNLHRQLLEEVKVVAQERGEQ